MPQIFNNNAATVLAATKPAGATSMLVATGHGARFPQPASGEFFTLTLFKIVDGVESNFEVVRCTARFNDFFTIEGAQEGTAHADFAAGDQVSMRLTAKWLNDRDDVIAPLAAGSGGGKIGVQQNGSTKVRTVNERVRDKIHLTDYPLADPTGVSESGSAVDLARTYAMYPYVPAGRYKTDSTFRLSGLHGEGHVSRNNRRVRLPAAPRRSDLVSSVMAKLVGSVMAGGVTLLVGDSISDGYNVDDMKNSWFDMFVEMMNVNAQGYGDSKPEITNFGEPVRAKLTYSGSYAIGSKGPVERSLILQPGASMSFSGNYLYVDIVAQRSPGAGKVVMRRNGVTFRTIDLNGDAQDDWSSFATQVGQVIEQADYVLTAEDAPVEITGLWCLTGTNPPGLFGSRCALSASSTQLHSKDNCIASVLRHSRSLNPTARPVIFVALMVNNANTGEPNAGTTPEVYEAQLGKMFARYINDGAYVIAIGGITPSSAWPTVLANYPAIAVAQKKVCEQYGVPLLSLDAYDWVREGGVLSDGLHPNTAGNLLYLDMVLDFLASPAFDLSGGTQAARLHSQTAELTWYTTNQVAAVAASQNIRWWRQGPLVHVIGNLRDITSAGNPGATMCIKLPVPAVSAVRSSGIVSSISGFTVAGGHQWSIQTSGNVNGDFGDSRAILRTIDPTLNDPFEVTGVDAGAYIDFSLTYIAQD